jgi:hypothetical protein
MEGAIQSESSASRAQHSGTRPKLSPLTSDVKSRILMGSAQVPARFETAIEAHADEEKEVNSQLRSAASLNPSCVNTSLSKKVMLCLNLKRIFALLDKKSGSRTSTRPR